jgi:hypothetical protein
MAHGPARVLVDFDAERAGGPPGAAIARAPSVATVRLVADGQGRALEVSGRYDYITFRIRATGQPTRLQVKLSDTGARAGDDGIDVGELTRFLPQGLSAEWQQVAIPLGGLGVNRKALAALTILVTDPSDFSFAIDDIALKREPED